MLTLNPAALHKGQVSQEFLAHAKKLAFTVQTIYHLRKDLLGADAEDLLFSADSVQDLIEGEEE